MQQATWFYIIKTFKKKEEKFPTSLVLKKTIVLLLYFKFNGLVALFPAILANMSVVILCWPGCDVINFEVVILIIFLIKLLFLRDRKIRTKI